MDASRVKKRREKTTATCDEADVYIESNLIAFLIIGQRKKT